mmetsp:Transcript_1461/g.2670  ORF Transcript_1461/g.2670 Transcript_1461/m.2670 type:complete len:117 (+) Transcript_1461:235-585(+)
MTTEDDNRHLVHVRERQWMYLGPIAATPLAHIAVTLYRDAKTPKQKQLLLGVGILGSTALTLGMRLYLMCHAGYPGQDMDPNIAKARVLAVTEEEKEAILNPSVGKIAKEAFRGFG